MKKCGTQMLQTQRLILRRFVPEDAQAMFQNWASDPEVTKYLTWPAHDCLDTSKKVLADWIPLYEDGAYFNWAICPRETNRPIGAISVVRLDEEVEAAEIGYCIGRRFWGQGMVPEALKAVMDYLFDEAGLGRVAACHDANNPKSGRVMEKAGMIKEGVLRQSAKNNQGICDAVWYAALKSDRP